jgi:hypothetical protein
MKAKEINDLALYQDAVYFTYLFGKAVKEAKETNRRHGLPSALCSTVSVATSCPTARLRPKTRWPGRRS